MAETSGMDWDAVERKAKKTYASATCPRCGRTIREGAWGSRSSNWKKHCDAHDRADAKKEAEGMFKVQVIADNSGTWCGNALLFETREKAETYARDLMMRWTLVREWRVVPAEKEP